ncbi:MAG: TIGR04552 family protein [Flavobacteriaceae bacterium]|nr:TIGR04552 family protein [Flavobacteriaceae bacterium]
MNRPNYLDHYNFNWETLGIMANGTSSLDAKNYLWNFDTREHTLKFLEGYGYDISDPIQNAEMFGNFQEAIQFIKKYFLSEGRDDGLNLVVPSVFYSITDVSELLLIASGKSELKTAEEDVYWASIILKIMHTILHVDKDLRHRYFTTIQTQIFDRFYKYLNREDDKLFLGDGDKNYKIPLYDFETKSTKSRESIIIKLLHKKENVAEELFDRIGVRFITYSKIDCLRLLHFLSRNYIIMVNNIKPSRSQNSLFNLEHFKNIYTNKIKIAIKEELSEEDFLQLLDDELEKITGEELEHKNNVHTSSSYRAIHFTSRQLIRYQNPFYKGFSRVREFAKKNDPNNEVTRKLLDLDTSLVANDIKFFYPFEIQISDLKSHEENTKGQASHEEYKKSQITSARDRLFTNLLEFKGLIR